MVFLLFLRVPFYLRCNVEFAKLVESVSNKPLWNFRCRPWQILESTKLSWMTVGSKMFLFEKGFRVIYRSELAQVILWCRSKRVFEICCKEFLLHLLFVVTLCYVFVARWVHRLSTANMTSWWNVSFDTCVPRDSGFVDIHKKWNKLLFSNVTWNFSLLSLGTQFWRCSQVRYREHKYFDKDMSRRFHPPWRSEGWSTQVFTVGCLLPNPLETRSSFSPAAVGCREHQLLSWRGPSPDQSCTAELSGHLQWGKANGARAYKALSEASSLEHTANHSKQWVWKTTTISRCSESKTWSVS